MQFPESEWIPAPTLYYAVLEELPLPLATQIRQDTLKVIHQVFEVNSSLDDETSHQLLSQCRSLLDMLMSVLTAGTTEETLMHSSQLDMVLEQRNALAIDLELAKVGLLALSR